MPRLNTVVTSEAIEILKEEAERIGSSVGTIITLLALEKKKEKQALEMVEIYNQEKAKEKIAKK